MPKHFKPVIHDWELADVLQKLQDASKDPEKARTLVRCIIRTLGREFDLITQKGVVRMKLKKRFLASFVKLKGWGS
jgi:hypothetical protein